MKNKLKKLERNRRANGRRKPIKNWATSKGKYAIEPGQDLEGRIHASSDRSVLVELPGKKNDVIVTGIPSNLGVDPKDLKVGMEVRVDVIMLSGEPEKPWLNAIGS